MCALHTGLAQGFLRALDLRRELARGYRTDVTVDQTRDVIRIVHDDLLSARAQIRKLLHHLIGRFHIQPLAALRVFKAHACHHDIAVDRVIRLRIV